MAKPLRMGVLGAGSIGLRGALAHLSIGDYAQSVVLGAVCDTVPGRAAAAAEKFGVPQAFEDYDEMLANGDIDAITVGTPIGMHYDQGVKAIEAGKHVHFNKTMTTTVAEADDLIRRAEAKGIKLVASPGEMLRPHNKRIRQLIQDGKLGQLIWAATGAGFGDYHEHERVREGNDVLSNIDPSWYWRKPGGGPLYDMTVYGLHTLTGILGPAQRVTAVSGTAIKEREFKGNMVPTGCDDNTLILVDFGNALFAFVYGTASGTLTPFARPTFFGTKGSITDKKLNNQPIDYPGREKAEALNDSALLPHVTGQHEKMEEAHVYEDIMQLVDLVREGTPTISTPEHARHVIDIIESGYRAAETGTAQDLTTTFTPAPGA
ncbi:MAG: Gfo/Idh/MocA family oxidoreductase [Abitibacteriaceae bacterium]|nr:Gfo/Idh/MocA family oxidoreductase [Abditibacteriaceae bacterium]